MKNYILIIIFFISCKILTSQDNADSYLTRPLDGLYLNLLGDASIVSMHYEKLFPINRNLFITSKLGLGYSSELLAFGPFPESYITVPFHITTIVGRNRSFVEIGIGATLSLGTPNSSVIYPVFGYRLQPLIVRKTSFRIIAQYPIVSNDIPFFSPIGFNLGVSF